MGFAWSAQSNIGIVYINQTSTGANIRNAKYAYITVPKHLQGVVVLETFSNGNGSFILDLVATKTIVA